MNQKHYEELENYLSKKKPQLTDEELEQIANKLRSLSDEELIQIANKLKSLPDEEINETIIDKTISNVIKAKDTPNIHYLDTGDLDNLIDQL